MTKDGLVEVNQATGEESRVSQRGQDFQLKQQPQEAHNIADSRVASTHGGRTGRQVSSGGTAQTERQEDFSSHISDSKTIRQVTGSDAQSAEPVVRQSPVDSSFTQRQETTQSRQQGTKYQQKFQTDAQSRIDSPQSADGSATTPYPANALQGDVSAPTTVADSTPLGALPTNPIKRAPDSLSSDTPQADGATPEPSRFTDSRRLKFGEQRDISSKGTKPNQRSTKYTKAFSADKDSPADAAPSRTSPDGKSSAQDAAGKSSRLQFAGDEVAPSKKLEKSRLKAERSSGKLSDAKKRLPTQRRVRATKTTDPTSGKKKRKLTFEKEVKSQRAHVKGALPLRPVKAGANAAIGFGHKKLYQVEQENVGTQAGHKAELMAEGVARKAYRMHKTAPYRRVAKLERQVKKRTIKFQYQKALHDNPKLKSNMVSRLMQKQKIKRQYAKAAREAKRGAKNVKKTGEFTAKVAQAVGGFIRRHPVGVGITLVILLLVFVIMTMFGSCSNMATGVLSSVTASSYVAEDQDIDNAELAYTEWEADLLLEVQNAESTHSGYDEYRYNVGDVSHDPYELMAYLTARYQDFTFAEVQADLRAIFDDQYQLSFVEEIEIRTRMVTKYRSVYDDEGNYEGEEEYEEEEEYEWYVLNVNLSAQSFSDVVIPKLNAEQREHFEVLMQTKGNRQYALNPFDFNWLPYVSDNYGWRVHPISGEKDNHRGIDIAVAQGTEILATHDGVVTLAGNSGGYGLVVVIENDKGLTTKYAHCSTLLVSAGQTVTKGEPIAKVGSTGNSTGPHLHFEVLQDGQYLNPLFFSETGDDGSGRIPPGSPGGIDYPDYPGTPLGDGSYAALIAEAELHLGKKYVFGASGPANFDCSGFVCWVLDKSGVKPMGRTNAQGLFNMSTPVSPENAKPGDLIFFTGTYSTPNACSHVGIYVGNGQMIHCGDPISYASINSKYWQDHFYSFGRIN